MIPVKWVDGPPIQTETILLAEGGYNYTFSIDKTSTNATQAKSPGGNALFYAQHKIDGSVASVPNVNTVARFALRTSQWSTADVNDAVVIYSAIYNDGHNVGAFGDNCDVYHADTGNGATFGSNRELHRLTPGGFTVGYHVRSMDGLNYWDNDYAYLASPSVAGNRGFSSVFSAGSEQTGHIDCKHVLDSRWALASGAVVQMTGGQSVALSEDPAVGKLRFDPVTGFTGLWRDDGMLIWGVNQSNGEVKTMWKPA